MGILLVTIDPGNKKKTNLLTKQLKFGYHLQGQAWPYFLDCPRIWGEVIYAFGKWASGALPGRNVWRVILSFACMDWEGLRT